MNIVNSNHGLSRLSRQVFTSPAEAARSLIKRMVAQALEKAEKDSYFVALSGGSTPDVLFKLWADEYAHTTPWNKFRFFWVDERCVPPSDEASNYGRFKLLLADRIPELQEGVNVFRIIGEADPEGEALRYSKLVSARVPQAYVGDTGIPRFDMVMLGVGNDGHTSSIFPGQEALLTVPSPYRPSVQPQTGVRRVAMTGGPMIQARQTVFLVTGEGKADILDRIFNHNFDCPARRVMSQALVPEIVGDQPAFEKVQS